jgi:hypothetical protein
MMATKKYFQIDVTRAVTGGLTVRLTIFQRAGTCESFKSEYTFLNAGNPFDIGFQGRTIVVFAVRQVHLESV